MWVSGTNSGQSKGTQGNQTWRCPIFIWPLWVSEHEGNNNSWKQLYSCEECVTTFKSKYGMNLHTRTGSQLTNIYIRINVMAAGGRAFRQLDIARPRITCIMLGPYSGRKTGRHQKLMLRQYTFIFHSFFHQIFPITYLCLNRRGHIVYHIKYGKIFG